MKTHMTAEDLARLFHDTYERLAPTYGYETKASTKIFDSTSPNGKLMIAVCKTLLFELTAFDVIKVHGPIKKPIKRKSYYAPPLSTRHIFVICIIAYCLMVLLT